MAQKKQLLYLRPVEDIPANTKDFRLISWNPTKYDTRERLSKIQIASIGNTISDNIIYRLEYGEVWTFDYQLSPAYDPLLLAAPLDVEDKIEVFVTNNSASSFIAEMTIMGTYESGVLKEERRP